MALSNPEPLTKEEDDTTYCKTEQNDSSPFTFKHVRRANNQSTSYTYIERPEQLTKVLEELDSVIKNTGMIGVGCEGMNLCRFGTLTIISIGTKDTVYVIDVMKIGMSIFDGNLRKILEDPSIEKLMFDCREDADNLYHNHKVRLDGVLDVQLLEVKPNVRRTGYTKVKSLTHCMELYTINEKTLLDMKSRAKSTIGKDGRGWGE